MIYALCLLTRSRRNITDDAGNYAEYSRPHFPIFEWTVVGELDAWPWAADGDRIKATITGYYVSADYGGGNICIYEWIEDWDIQLTDAVQNGDAWLATAFEGTMLRIEQPPPTSRAAALPDGCRVYSRPGGLYSGGRSLPAPKKYFSHSSIHSF